MNRRQFIKSLLTAYGAGIVGDAYSGVVKQEYPVWTTGSFTRGNQSYTVDFYGFQKNVLRGIANGTDVPYKKLSEDMQNIGFKIYNINDDDEAESNRWNKLTCCKRNG